MKVPDVEHISYREEFHTDVLQFLRVNRKLLGFGKHFAFTLPTHPASLRQRHNPARVLTVII